MPRNQLLSKQHHCSGEAQFLLNLSKPLISHHFLDDLCLYRSIELPKTSSPIKMCFVFTCGEHEFSSYLKGYEGVTCQCHNCGNYSAHVIKRWPWFTFCFVPVLPLAFHAYEDVVCTICNFAEPLQNRRDVMAQHPNAGNELQPQQHYGGPPGGGGPPQGWGGGGAPPGAKTNQQMQYG